MTKNNPYATPKSQLDAITRAEKEGEGELYRDGSYLVMQLEGSLPNRCVKCNSPASGRIRRSLHWHHPAFLAFVLLPPLYVIVALIVRKSLTVDAPLCKRHLLLLRLIRTGAVLGLLGSFVWLLLGYWILQSHGWIAVLGSALSFFGAISIDIAVYRPLTAKRIGNNYAWLKRASVQFLATFPVAPQHLIISKTKSVKR